MIRFALRALGWLGLVLLVSATVLAIYVARNWDRTRDDVPAPDLHASTDPAIIARGEYLATGPAHCTECHVSTFEDFQHFYDETGQDGESRARALSGGYAFSLGPLGTIYSKNLTPDPETGIGRYTDPQIARMLRHGVRPDGHASIPLLMPFGNMSDEDLVAILSFLRAQPPVRNAVPENEWTLLGKVMRTFVAAAQPNMDVRPPRTAPAQEPTIARGEYIARSVANCGGCHTAFNELTGVPTVPTFSGGNPIEPSAQAGADRSLWFKPPNITPRDGSALMKFPDRATFVARFKVGGRHYDGSPMPWEAFSRMSPEDIGALYEFLHAQPPSGEPAPEDPRVKAPGSTD
jgi:mono/diheme cytochrome c family protein